MSRGEYVLVLPIPFHLRPRNSPSAQSHERLVPYTEIPPADPRVHRDRRDEIWIVGVPIDIGDRAGMGVDTLVQASLCGEVPYQELLR